VLADRKRHGVRDRAALQSGKSLRMEEAKARIEFWLRRRTIFIAKFSYSFVSEFISKTLCFPSSYLITQLQSLA